MNPLDQITQRLDALEAQNIQKSGQQLSYPLDYQSKNTILSSLGRRYVVSNSISGTNAQTAAFYGVFFVAPFNCSIQEIYENHYVAGTDGSAVTLQIENLKDTQSFGGGVSLLSTPFSLKATAKTTVQGSISSSTGFAMAKGDRLAFSITGTPTSLQGVCVTLILNEIV